MDFQICAEINEIHIGLSISEYVTMRQVLAAADGLDPVIVGVPSAEITRLSERLAAEPVSDHGRKSMILSPHDVGGISSVFLAATSISYSPLRNREEVRRLESELLHICDMWLSARYGDDPDEASSAPGEST